MEQEEALSSIHLILQRLPIDRVVFSMCCLFFFVVVVLFDTSQNFNFFSDRVATYCRPAVLAELFWILFTVTAILPRIFSLLDRTERHQRTTKKNNDVLCVVGAESFHHQSTLAVLETYIQVVVLRTIIILKVLVLKEVSTVYMLLLIGPDDGRRRRRCAGMLDGYQQQRYVEATSCGKKDNNNILSW
jgi:hypothetical protein